MKSIPFNKPTYLGKEYKFVQQAIKSNMYSGSGPFNKKCSDWFNKKINCLDSFLLPSCTSALEMALILADIGPGDEVILPSYTFSSCATAIVLHGGVPVFVDSSTEDFNISIADIKRSITKKTKVIMPMHYSGQGCEMIQIKKLAKERNIILIEDSAQAIGCSYKNKPLGSFGDLSVFSFHETKNITCGEGGMLCINNKKLLERSYIVREKGTNRRQFVRGEVDKYMWTDKGSSYLTSEFQAAFLLYQLKNMNLINKNRLKLWKLYHDYLEDLEKKALLRRPFANKSQKHNGHIYSLMLKTRNERDKLKTYLEKKGISTATHYVPLHNSKAGKKYGKSLVKIINANKINSCTLRLPIFYGIKESDIKYVADCVKSFFK